MRFAVMVEGQEDVTWEQWLALAATAERLGFEALLRSDHYGSVDGDTARGSLDAWSTICGLAATTTTLRLGTLVSPATFRHPSVLAKSAVTADHISGGRIEVGIGTGWHEAEHRAYGFPFPPMKVRMDRLAEQLEIIAGSWAPGPFSFAGEHYAVEDLDALPKPVQDPLPLLMGGAAGPRGAALAARFATEYNVVHQTPEEADAAPRADRRRVRGCRPRPGDDDVQPDARVPDRRRRGRPARARRAARPPAPACPSADLRGGWLSGTPEQFAARLREYEAAGVERVMLQHHLVDDHAALELIASAVVPALA